MPGAQFLKETVLTNDEVPSTAGKNIVVSRVVILTPETAGATGA